MVPRNYTNTQTHTHTLKEVTTHGKPSITEAVVNNKKKNKKKGNYKIYFGK
eukprot:m.46335 g.46335  ORF g.46335 m.46335 type:complete len:51 (-) comp7263_c0_seq1:83-235(-)